MVIPFGLIALGALFAYSGLKGKTVIETLQGLPGSLANTPYESDLRASASRFASLTSGGGGATGGSKSAGSPASGNAVDRMIAEADRIDRLHLPYRWGGSHGPGKTPPNGPFDCSSAVSHLLQVGGFMNTTFVSGMFMGWGKSGPGKEVTIYANPTHVYIKLRGRYWGTSHENPNGGPGWHSARSGAGFTARHPRGLAGAGGGTPTRGKIT